MFTPANVRFWGLWWKKVSMGLLSRTTCYCSRPQIFGELIKRTSNPPPSPKSFPFPSHLMISSLPAPFHVIFLRFPPFLHLVLPCHTLRIYLCDSTFPISYPSTALCTWNFLSSVKILFNGVMFFLYVSYNKATSGTQSYGENFLVYSLRTAVKLLLTFTLYFKVIHFRAWVNNS